VSRKLFRAQKTLTCVSQTMIQNIECPHAALAAQPHLVTLSLSPTTNPAH